MSCRLAKEGETKCMMILKDGTKFEVSMPRKEATNENKSKER